MSGYGTTACGAKRTLAKAAMSESAMKRLVHRSKQRRYSITLSALASSVVGSLLRTVVCQSARGVDRNQCAERSELYCWSGTNRAANLRGGSFRLCPGSGDAAGPPTMPIHLGRRSSTCTPAKHPRIIFEPAVFRKPHIHQITSESRQSDGRLGARTYLDDTQLGS